MSPPCSTSLPCSWSRPTEAFTTSRSCPCQSGALAWTTCSTASTTGSPTTTPRAAAPSRSQRGRRISRCETLNLFTVADGKIASMQTPHSDPTRTTASEDRHAEHAAVRRRRRAEPADAASDRRSGRPTRACPPCPGSRGRLGSATPNATARARDGHAEQAAVVREEVVELQAGLCQLFLNRVARELRADLGPDLLAVVEGQLETCALDADRLRAIGPQSHLDPGVGLVEESDVLERIGREVRAKTVVHDKEHVAVELCRHALAVVVGSLENAAVLDEIGADQEPVVRTHQLAQSGQERGSLVPEQVPNRAAEEGEEAPLSDRYPGEVATEVTDDTVHVEPRVELRELRGTALHRRL